MIFPKIAQRHLSGEMSFWFERAKLAPPIGVVENSIVVP